MERQYVPDAGEEAYVFSRESVAAARREPRRPAKRPQLQTKKVGLIFELDSSSVYGPLRQFGRPSLLTRAAYRRGCLRAGKIRAGTGTAAPRRSSRTYLSAFRSYWNKTCRRSLPTIFAGTLVPRGSSLSGARGAVPLVRRAR